MAGDAFSLAADKVEVPKLHHVGFVGWHWEGEDEGAGSGVSKLAVVPFQAWVLIVDRVEMVDETFDGVSNVGCQGCVGVGEVGGRGFNCPSGHFVEDGLSGVRRVGFSTIGGLEKEVVGGKVVKVDDASDDDEVVWYLRFQERCYCGGEGVFGSSRRNVPNGFCFVAMDGALVFGCDGFAKRPSK